MSATSCYSAGGPGCEPGFKQAGSAGRGGQGAAAVSLPQAVRAPREGWLEAGPRAGLGRGDGSQGAAKAAKASRGKRRPLGWGGGDASGCTGIGP